MSVGLELELVAVYVLGFDRCLVCIRVVHLVRIPGFFFFRFCVRVLVADLAVFILGLEHLPWHFLVLLVIKNIDLLDHLEVVGVFPMHRDNLWRLVSKLLLLGSLDPLLALHMKHALRLHLVDFKLLNLLLLLGVVLLPLLLLLLGPHHGLLVLLHLLLVLLSLHDLVLADFVLQVLDSLQPLHLLAPVLLELGLQLLLLLFDHLDLLLQALLAECLNFLLVYSFALPEHVDVGVVLVLG